MMVWTQTLLRTPLARSKLCRKSHRFLATAATQAKKEGDISSVFVSLSGGEAPNLPEKFADVKKKIVSGREDKLLASWERLLDALKRETKIIEERGSEIIPSVTSGELQAKVPGFQDDLKKRGCAVIRDVVPMAEARAYKEEVEQYVKDNPSTKVHDPQVFELYWSSAQVRARSHPNVLATQRQLMKTWHTDDPDALISTSHPATYADQDPTARRLWICTWSARRCGERGTLGGERLWDRRGVQQNMGR
ncbi:MAG: hypothetical protein M1818_004983 [Claussenomyces sp. TS43310]|nr:MAG: hypothetical protein M1818_004983 [Claussenomyces sp. TS43310]